jgi:ParB family chromosome partitioning protein
MIPVPVEQKFIKNWQVKFWKMASRRGLGKGLDALIPTSVIEQEEFGGQAAKGERIVLLPVDAIIPNRFQARKVFDEEKLRELSESIKEHGVVQPVVVRQNETGKYELVAGERRWKATRLLGMESIPAIIKDYSAKELTAVSLIENIQRQDLNPMEEAAAYQLLMKEFSLSQENLAKKLGKSRPFIANMVRLLSLEPEVQKMVESGSLSMGHARSLLSLKGIKQISAAETIMERGLSVRQTEEYIKNLVAQQGDAKQQEEEPIPDQEQDALRAVLADVEESLRSCLGTQVRIKSGKKKDRGSIEIEYYGQEELERIIDLIVGS